MRAFIRQLLAAKSYRSPYRNLSCHDDALWTLNLDSVHMNVAHLSTPLCNVAARAARLVLIHCSEYHRRRQGPNYPPHHRPRHKLRHTAKPNGDHVSHTCYPHSPCYCIRSNLPPWLTFPHNVEFQLSLVVPQDDGFN